MKYLKFIALPILLLILLNACSKNDSAVPATPTIHFVFKFDSTQERLNNFGQLSTIPPGNAAQSPRFNKMSAHYIELAPGQSTALGTGAVLYRAPETTIGGATAIDFDQSKFAGNNQEFFSMPLSSLAAGSYNWLRVSLAYQNYDINFRAGGLNLTGTIASFIGFRTYIRNYTIKDSTQTLNANKDQGFWAFETSTSGFGVVSSGQAPAGATTVPNPLALTSPIPVGSCVVTGQFAAPLVITGNETADITIVVSLSTNKSFEWTDPDGNGTFDPPTDHVVDMGIRGLIPIKQ